MADKNIPEYAELAERPAADDALEIYDDSASANKHILPDNLAKGGTIALFFNCGDETTDLTTGTVLTFRMPFAFTLDAVRAHVTEAPTDADLEVDLQEEAVSVLSTVISVDGGETSSEDSADPAVISDSSLADDAEMTVIIDQVGSTNPGKGLKLWLIGRRA
jgi:hypothetical protein